MSPSTVPRVQFGVLLLAARQAPSACSPARQKRRPFDLWRSVASSCLLCAQFCLSGMRRIARSPTTLSKLLGSTRPYARLVKTRFRAPKIWLRRKYCGDVEDEGDCHLETPVTQNLFGVQLQLWRVLPDSHSRTRWVLPDARTCMSPKALSANSKVLTQGTLHFSEDPRQIKGVVFQQTTNRSEQGAVKNNRTQTQPQHPGVGSKTKENMRTNFRSPPAVCQHRLESVYRKRRTSGCDVRKLSTVLSFSKQFTKYVKYKTRKTENTNKKKVKHWSGHKKVEKIGRFFFFDVRFQNATTAPRAAIGKRFAPCSTRTSLAAC